MELPIKSIVIEDRARQDLGDIGDLAESIREIGLLHPPVVRSKGDQWLLVAGARRIAAAESLGHTRIQVTVSRSIDDTISALIAERDENTCRKPFTISEGVALAEQIEGQIAAEAKARMLAGKPEPSSNLDEGPTARRTDARIAKAVGTSRNRLVASGSLPGPIDPTLSPKLRRWSRPLLERYAAGAPVVTELRAVAS